MSDQIPEFMQKNAPLSLVKADLPEGVIRFRASDSTPDRHEDIILAKGIKLANFKANPVIFWQHQSFMLPIGKGLKAWEEDDALYIDVQFDLEDEVAKEIYRKVKAGFIHAGSIGAQIIKASPRKDASGILIEECDLAEFSIVTIPANPNAVVVQRSFEGSTTDLLKAAQMVLEAFSKGIVREDEAEERQEDEAAQEEIEEEQEPTEKEALDTKIAELEEELKAAKEERKALDDEDEEDDEDEVVEEEIDPENEEEQEGVKDDAAKTATSKFTELTNSFLALDNEGTNVDISKLFKELSNLTSIN